MTEQHMFGMPYDPNKRLMEELIQAITEQTAAITLLAESNQMLIQAMAESGDVDTDPYQTL